MVSESVQSVKSVVFQLSQILTRQPSPLKNCKACTREGKGLEDNGRSWTSRTARTGRLAGHGLKRI